MTIKGTSKYVKINYFALGILYSENGIRVNFRVLRSSRKIALRKILLKIDDFDNWPLRKLVTSKVEHFVSRSPDPYALERDS